jgi:membrane associated rhomboid family serine protease
VTVEGAEVRYCYRHPDRETGLSCSECGRPICAECVNYAPVGLRCPDHSGRPQGVKKVTTGVRRATFAGPTALVTKTLIGVNVGVFLLMLGSGAPVGQAGGWVFTDGALFVRLFDGEQLRGLAEGEWWRLVTAGFIHSGFFHLGMNMLMLWWFGAPLEQGIGRARFLGIYVVSLLSGSAGALLFSPQRPTVGASGAVIGLVGAMFVLERQAGINRGPAVTILVLNLLTPLIFPAISFGGHAGGAVGGALAMLALTRFGRAHAAYGRPGLAGAAGVVAVGVASVAVAWLQVQRVERQPPETAASTPASFSAAWAAASLASGTRKGEHET